MPFTTVLHTPAVQGVSDEVHVVAASNRTARTLCSDDDVVYAKPVP